MLRNAPINEKLIDNSYHPIRRFYNSEDSHNNDLIANQEQSYLLNYDKYTNQNNLTEQDSVNFSLPFNEKTNLSKFENSYENFSYLSISNKNKMSKSSMLKD